MTCQELARQYHQPAEVAPVENQASSTPPLEDPDAPETIVYMDPSDLEPNTWNMVPRVPGRHRDAATMSADIHETNEIDQALICWQRPGKMPLVVDGLERLAVALRGGLTRIPVILRDYKSEVEAMRAWIRLNVKRRHFDTTMKAYAARKLVLAWKAEDEALPPEERMRGDKWKLAAAECGTSDGTVSKLNQIMKSNEQDLIEAVLGGWYSVNEGAKKLEPRLKAKADFEQRIMEDVLREQARVAFEALAAEEREARVEQARLSAQELAQQLLANAQAEEEKILRQAREEVLRWLPGSISDMSDEEVRALPVYASLLEGAAGVLSPESALVAARAALLEHERGALEAAAGVFPVLEEIDDERLHRLTAVQIETLRVAFPRLPFGKNWVGMRVSPDGSISPMLKGQADYT